MINVNVVDTSVPETFNAMIYPNQHPNVYEYLRNQFNHLSTTITDSGKQMVEKSKQLMADFYDSTIERAAKSAIRMANNLINPNAIQRFNTLEDIQCAGPAMQRWIMCEPYIREKFHDQFCSGFGGTYIDLDPGFLREKQYDFRRVNTGIINFEGEGDDLDWVSRTHFEDLRYGDRELTFDEKFDIIETQRLARLFAEAGEDPTCPFGGKMG